MGNWFSNYQGLDWNPRKHQYNEVFLFMVTLIRDFFSLTRVETGLYNGTGAKIPYTLQRKQVLVSVASFKWNEAIKYPHYISPRLRFQIRIEEESGNVLFEGPLIVEFWDDFPTSAPRFKTEGGKYAMFESSEVNWSYSGHHIYQGGWFCTMGSGYKAYEWNPNSDTIITALNCAFDLLVWHVKQHGW